MIGLFGMGGAARGEQASLRELQETAPLRPAPELLDLLPTGPVDLELLPEPMLRLLLDVFGLKMRHDREKSLVDCEVTITSEIVDMQRDDATSGGRFRASRFRWYPLRSPPQTGSTPQPTQRPPNHPIPLPDIP